MSLVTLIRVHGKIDNSVTDYAPIAAHDNKSVVQHGDSCGDNIVNDYINNGYEIVDIQTIYDSENKLLLDIIYMRPSSIIDDDESGGNPSNEPTDPRDDGDGLGKSNPIYNRMIFKN
jgi:hypothetical protein